MKLRYSKDDYVNCWSRKERVGVAWWRLEIWKLRGIRRGLERGICPLYYELEDANHILLIRTGTGK
jgi:hypothetical protein